MNNLRGYIQQAREANMFDEVSMLESNLRMLQEEFKRQKEEEAVAAAKQQVTDMSLEEASNPFSEETEASSYVSFPTRITKPVFDEVSKELGVEDKNPFWRGGGGGG